MMTNPYAYYDDEPLPLNARPLSVSSDGEEEPDMEPRGPLELKGYFITPFVPAVKTYQINVVQNTFECRLPNDEFLQLSREEARKQVKIHGNEIDITVPGGRTYCFRCQNKTSTLTLARLEIWLRQPISDPEEAYNAVAGLLKKSILGFSFTLVIVLFLLWMLYMAYWDYPYWVFNRPGVLLYPAILNFGICLLRLLCAILLSAFLVLRLFGQINVRLLRIGTLLTLTFPVHCLIVAFVPELRIGDLHHHNPFTFFWVYCPLALYGIYYRYRRSEKQLQRDNGLI